mmetsp:Transcript_22588/g.46858  ORF Transcript_22588/g.46858 Transcript_22588/m.46858 type:complete len:263 (+) Transcript_22588:248-1036(+)
MKVILLADEANVESAKSICSVLESSFGISDVTIRSTSVPSDRLLSTVRSLSDESVVYAVICPAPSTFTAASESAAAVINLLEREAPAPVVSCADDAAATASSALRIARSCSPASDAIRLAVFRNLSSARQSSLVRDIQLQTSSGPYLMKISAAYDAGNQITGDGVTFTPTTDGSATPVRISGKVRDRYDLGDRLALVTTDRQSGFDRMLALVPYKGAVLNLTSAYWFEKTAHIIPNHIISVPHPNVSVVKKCAPFPIEFVVR